jgi:AI-2 transport protein TqsA
MSDLPKPENVSPPADSWGFLRRLAIATFGVLLFVLAVHILRLFQPILQPLFVGVFVGYLILPVHRWLQKHRVSGIMAYVVILTLILGGVVGLGTMVFSSFEQVASRLPEYEGKLDTLLQNVLDSLPVEIPNRQRYRVRELLRSQQGPEQGLATLLSALGTFSDFLTGAAAAFIYLVFLIAERWSFPRRMVLAFGDRQGSRVLDIVGSINSAISEYLAVKTFVSLLAGVLSFAVLWAYGVDFFLMWGIFIFLFNFIPYLGSLAAIAPPILLGFLQFDFLKGAQVAFLLIAVQIAIGNFVEPRMAGRRLGVSPLLILLALAFWGLLWGIVGMILAVPLLVIVKIVLDNIPETKPLATLMSNL